MVASQDSWYKNVSPTELMRSDRYLAAGDLLVDGVSNAGSVDQIIFGRNEPALHPYHETYASKLGDALVARRDLIQHATGTRTGINVSSSGSTSSASSLFGLYLIVEGVR